TWVSALGPSGKIAVAGAHGAYARVYGRLADGSQGTYLGYEGAGRYAGFVDFQVQSKPTRPGAVAFTPEGRILAGTTFGESYEQNTWAVTRFEETRGFLDWNWGSQGHA